MPKDTIDYILSMPVFPNLWVATPKGVAKCFVGGRRGLFGCVPKMVNYIKSGALNTRLFKELCKDMNSDHEVLLFYTAVRWLSKGNVVNRVFELKDEIKMFLEVQGKHDLVAYFNNEAWKKRVAYLADIFDQQNKLNLKLQGKETHIIQFQDNLQAFVAKLQNWRRKVSLGNIAMFEKLCSVVEESEGEVDEKLKQEITGHLESLEKEFQRYFPELKEESCTRTKSFLCFPECCQHSR